MTRHAVVNALAASALLYAAAGKAGSGAPPAPPVPGVPGAAPPVAKVEPKIASIRTDIAPPAPKRTGPRAGTSIYDFSKLEIGQSFGIIDTDKTAKKFGSTVTAANHRYDVPVLDAAGNPTFAQGAEIKDAAGTVTGHAKGKPIKTATRKFVCADVDPKTDPDGANLRVWRVTLPAVAPAAPAVAPAAPAA